ncbi:hypothetical protein BCR33DRAFT_840658 [Rhizoclosmatium globosum]|uniref:Uncharacterized protein n=1 Tax=Rhizoclosmatium globosum TaxID=329046 RepID=A0A1Y2B949_9FUNG|nr:hypothetical protein BCR33DRAFT_840658 [Rhizoclosmatium globosum]|eukprot:ORY31349.1 hypothetical protein BCR33DRAFT_840658 [Rhizoclosmatium globosum]
MPMWDHTRKKKWTKLRQSGRAFVAAVVDVFVPPSTPSLLTESVRTSLPKETPRKIEEVPSSSAEDRVCDEGAEALTKPLSLSFGSVRTEISTITNMDDIADAASEKEGTRVDDEGEAGDDKDSVGDDVGSDNEEEDYDEEEDDILEEEVYDESQVEEDYDEEEDDVLEEEVYDESQLEKDDHGHNGDDDALRTPEIFSATIFQYHMTENYSKAPASMISKVYQSTRAAHDLAHKYRNAAIDFELAVYDNHIRACLTSGPFKIPFKTVPRKVIITGENLSPQHPQSGKIVFGPKFDHTGTISIRVWSSKVKDFVRICLGSGIRDSTPLYAVSHTWNNAVDWQNFGVPMDFDYTANVFKAVKKAALYNYYDFKVYDKNYYVWLDYLSTNQHDPFEVREATLKMAWVYSTAVTTVVILENNLSPQKPQHWCNRVWSMQEEVLSKKLMFFNRKGNRLRITKVPIKGISKLGEFVYVRDPSIPPYASGNLVATHYFSGNYYDEKLDFELFWPEIRRRFGGWPGDLVYASQYCSRLEQRLEIRYDITMAQVLANFIQALIEVGDYSVACFSKTSAVRGWDCTKVLQIPPESDLGKIESPLGFIGCFGLKEAQDQASIPLKDSVNASELLQSKLPPAVGLIIDAVVVLAEINLPDVRNDLLQNKNKNEQLDVSLINNKVLDDPLSRFLLTKKRHIHQPVENVEIQSVFYPSTAAKRFHMNCPNQPVHSTPRYESLGYIISTLLIWECFNPFPHTSSVNNLPVYNLIKSLENKDPESIEYELCQVLKKYFNPEEKAVTLPHETVVDYERTDVITQLIGYLSLLESNCEYGRVVLDSNGLHVCKLPSSSPKIKTKFASSGGISDELRYYRKNERMEESSFGSEQYGVGSKDSGYREVRAAVKHNTQSDWNRPHMGAIGLGRMMMVEQNDTKFAVPLIKIEDCLFNGQIRLFYYTDDCWEVSTVHGPLYEGLSTNSTEVKNFGWSIVRGIMRE